MKNKIFSGGAFVLLISLWSSGCSDRTIPEPTTVQPTAAIAKNASSMGADYDAGYKVGMSDAVDLYKHMTFTASCPNGHTTDDPPKLAGDASDFDGGSGSGTCTYWVDSQNGPDQYRTQIHSEIQSGIAHENAATTNAEADYYHGYVQGLNDGSLGK